MLSAVFRSTYSVPGTPVVGHPLPISLSGNLRHGLGFNTTMKLYFKFVHVKDSAIAASCDEPLAAGRVGRTPRGGSTQSATPRGLDCGYRMPHLARSDSYRSICATAATALLQHHRVCWVLACTAPGRTRYLVARAAGTELVSMSTREARDWSTYNEYSYRNSSEANFELIQPYLHTRVAYFLCTT